MGGIGRGDSGRGVLGRVVDVVVLRADADIFGG